MNTFSKYVEKDFWADGKIIKLQTEKKTINFKFEKMPSWKPVMMGGTEKNYIGKYIFEPCKTARIKI